MQNDPVTPQEFAKKIRAKHPNAYKDIDDDVLVRKMLEKYPQYKDMVSFDQKKSPSGTPLENTSGADPEIPTSKSETPSISKEQQEIDDEFASGLKEFSRKALSSPHKRYQEAESQLKEKYGDELFDDLTKSKIQLATFKKQLEEATTEDERILAQDNLKGLSDRIGPILDDPLLAEMESAASDHNDNIKKWQEENDKSEKRIFPKHIEKWKETVDRMSSFGKETDIGSTQQGAIMRSAAKFSQSIMDIPNRIRSQFRSEEEVKNDPKGYDGVIDWLSKRGQNSVDNINYIYPVKAGNETIFDSETALVEKASGTASDMAFIILGTKGLGAAGMGSKASVVGSVANFTYGDMLQAAEEAGLKDEAKHRFALTSSLSVGLVNLIGGGAIEGAGVKEAVKSVLTKEGVKKAIGSGSKDVTKTIIKDVIGEIGEEVFFEPAAQALNEMVFNVATEADFDLSRHIPTAKELAETIVLTTMLSGPVSASTAKTRSDAQIDKINYDSAKNPHKFEQLLEDVQLDPEKKEAHKQRIRKLSEQLKNADIKDVNQERQVASDQDRINVLDEKLKGELDAGTKKAFTIEKKELEEKVFSTLHPELAKKEESDTKEEPIDRAEANMRNFQLLNEETTDEPKTKAPDSQKSPDKSEQKVEETKEPVQGEAEVAVPAEITERVETKDDRSGDGKIEEPVEIQDKDKSSTSQEEPIPSQIDEKKGDLAKDKSTNPLMDRVKTKDRKQGDEFIGEFQKRFDKDQTTPDDHQFSKDKREFASEINRVSDSVIEEVIKEQGDKAYEVLVSESKTAIKNAVDDPVSASFGTVILQKVAARQIAEGDLLGFVKTSELIKGAGSSFSRGLVALKSDSSPEALISLATSSTIGRVNEFLKTPNGDTTNEAAIVELQKKVKALEKQVKTAKNEGTAKKRRAAKSKQQKAIDAIKSHFTDTSTGFAMDPKKQADEQIKLAKAMGQLVASTVELGVIDTKDLISKVSDILRRNGVKNATKHASDAVKAYTKEVEEDLAKIINSFGDRMSQKKLDKLLDKLVANVDSKSFTSEVIKEATGINYDPKLIAKVQNIAAKIMKSNSTIQKNHYFDQLNDALGQIKKNDPLGMALDSLMEVYYLNMLSGASTVERGSIGATVTTAMSYITNTIESPIGSISAMAHILSKGSGTGIATGLQEAKYIMSTGRSNFDYFDTTPTGQRHLTKVMNKSFNEYRKSIGKGEAIGKNTFQAMFKLLWTIPNTMYRLLISFDPLVVHGKIEHNSFLAQYNDSLANGSSIAVAIKEAKQSLKYDKIPELQEIAEKEIKEMEAQGESITGFKRQRVKELLMKERGEEFSRTMMEDARESVLMSEPKGTLGKAVKTIQSPVLESDAPLVKIRKIIQRTIFPILRVPANFVNMSLDYTPVGLFRNLISRKEDSSIDKRRRYAQVAQGAGLMITMMAMAFDWDDEGMKPKDGFRITGNGTTDWFKNRQIDESWKELSIQWKKDKSKGWTKENTTSIKYVDNPIGVVLFPLGKYSDMHLLKDEKRLANVGQGLSSIPFYLMSSAEFGYQQTFAQGFKEVVDLASGVMTEDSQRLADQGEKFVSRRLSTITTPNIYRQLGDMYERIADKPEKEAEVWYQNMYKDLPFFSELLSNSATDALGYPKIKEENKPYTLAFAQKVFEGQVSSLEKRYAGWKIVRKYPNLRLASVFPPATGEDKNGKRFFFTPEQRDEMKEVYKMNLNRLLEENKTTLLKASEKEMEAWLKNINKGARRFMKAKQAEIELAH